MGGGVISQIGGWIAWPFKNTIPVSTLILAVLLIATVVWLLADSTHWPTFEEIVPPVEA